MTKSFCRRGATLFVWECGELDGDELAKMLAKSPHFGELDTLSLGFHVGEEGKMTLVHSPYLRGSVRVAWSVKEWMDVVWRGRWMEEMQTKETIAEIRGYLTKDARALVNSRPFWSMLHEVYLDDPEWYKSTLRPYLREHWPKDVTKFTVFWWFSSSMQEKDLLLELVPFARFSIDASRTDHARRLVSLSLVGLLERLVIRRINSATDTMTCLEALLNNPHTNNVRHLQWNGAEFFKDEQLERIAHAGCFHSLVSLSLGYRGATELGIQHLAQSTHFPALRELTLSVDTVDSDDMMLGWAEDEESPLELGVLLELIHTPHLPQLKQLRMFSQQLRHEPSTRTKRVGPAGESSLEDLQLGNMSLDDNLLEELFSKANVPALRSLRLSNGLFGDRGLCAIAQCSSLGRLEHLTIHLEKESMLGREGLTALLDSPHLHHLSELVFCHCQLDDEAVQVFANHPGMRRIRKLRLRSNHVSPESVEAIVNSPFCEQLEELDLGL